MGENNAIAFGFCCRKVEQSLSDKIASIRVTDKLHSSLSKMALQHFVVILAP